ncbi:unnamed protein product [Clonostachys chloroleuca]|uniref:Uncharacterized protein n=1 Tax=Clonostachys chloroleuca TaxID=1926264 RepID=A0AA35Q258_9HYPO|nr:unnamed protein product [Clonostachys chloroleuca]
MTDWLVRFLMMRPADGVQPPLLLLISLVYLAPCTGYIPASAGKLPLTFKVSMTGAGPPFA